MVSAHSDAKYTIDTSDYRCDDCADEVACKASYYSAVILDDGRFHRRNYCSGCWKRNAGGGPEETPRDEPRPWSDVFASWRTRRPAAPSERPKKVRFDAQLALEFFLRLAEEPDGVPEEGPSADGAIERSASGDPSVDDGDTVDRADSPAAAPGAADGEQGERADMEGPGNARPDAGDPPGDPGAALGRTSERDQVRFFLALLLVRKKVLKFRSSLDRGGAEWLVLVDRETPPRVHEVLNPGLSDDQIERVKDKLGELLQMQI